MSLEIEKLYNEGYCYYNDLFSYEFTRKLEESSKSLISLFEKKSNLENYNLSLVNSDNSSDFAYQLAANSQKVVMHDKRKLNTDNGMIDIFNPHLLKSESSELFISFRKKIKEYCLSSIEEKLKKKYELGPTNIYQHYKTVNPRSAHYDNEESFYKLFLFLSDVNTVNGSFFFYKDSHKQKIKKRIMNRVNKYILGKKDLEDINFVFNDKKKINLTGKIGTTVLTDVSGLHGCNPFEINNENKRLVIVQRISVKE